MNSQDRALLELAAKAAGVAGVFVEAHGPDIGQDAAGIGRPGARYGDRLWNPLGDDGHCARMEADLLLRVTFHDGWVSVGHASFGSDEFCEFFCDHEDRNAARRRASTCAAAEICKTK
jgi:hypothetical protein